MKNGFTINYTMVVKKKLSTNGVLAYIGVNMCRSKFGARYMISIGELYYSLFELGKFSKRQCQRLEEGLKELRDKDILVDVNELNFKVLLAEVNETIPRTKSFWVNVDSNDVRRILDISYQRNREVLRYYILFLGLRNNDNKLDKKYKMRFMTHNLMMIASKTDLSTATVAKYNDILEENEIIYIFRRAIPNEFDPYKKGNVYCLYKDKEITKEYLMMNRYYLYEDNKNEGAKEVLKGGDSNILANKERYEYYNAIFKKMDSKCVPSFDVMKDCILYFKEYNRAVKPIIDKSKESGKPSGYESFDEANIEPLIDLAYDDSCTDYPDGFLERYGYRLVDAVKSRTL